MGTSCALDRVLSAAVVCVLALVSSTAWAQETKTWDGGGTNTNWSNASNWNPDGVPDPDDVVQFSDLGTESEEAVNIDVDVSVAGFTINSGFDNTSASPQGATFTIAAGKRIMVRGNFTINSGALVKFGNPERLTVTGTFTVATDAFNPDTGKFLLISGTAKTHVFGDAIFPELVVTGPTGPSTTGLVGYWKNDETTNGANAADSSGNGTTLTASGTTATPSGQGADVLFTNTRGRTFSAGNYLSAGSLPNHLKNFTDGNWTLSAWVWPGTIDSSGSDIITGGDNYMLRIAAVSSSRHKVRAVFRYNSSAWYTCESDVTMPAAFGGWYHIAGVHDGTNDKVYVYVNGSRKECDYSGLGYTQSYDQAYEFRVGNHPNSSNFDYAGTLDDVRVYNRALSDDEVVQLAAGAGGSGSVTHTASSALVVDSALTVESGATLTLQNRLYVGGVATIAGTLNAAAGYPLYAYNLVKSGSGSFSESTGTVVIGNTSNATLAHTTFYGLRVTEPNLVAHFRLDEGTGNTTDTSANGVTGTLNNGVVWKTSGLNTRMNFPNTGALTFDGSDDHVSFPITFPHPNPITISAWIYRTGNGENFPRLVILPGARFYLGHDVSGATYDNIGFLYDCAGQDGNWQVNTTFSRNAWHHVAVTFDGGSTSNDPVFYVDGVHQTNYQERQAPDRVCNMNSGTGYLGGAATSSNYLGHMDDVRIYTGVLSAAEILALYNGSPYRTSNGTITLSGATTTVSGDLSIHGSTLAIGSNALNVAGSWLSYFGNVSGTGTVTLNGAAAGKSILSNGMRFPVLTVSGSGGGWTAQDRLYVDGALSVSNGTLAITNQVVHAGSLSHTAGNFTTTGSTVVIDGASASTLTVGTALNHLRIEDPTEANLLGYWKLDDLVGSAVRDSSGNGYHGSFLSGGNGVTWATTAQGAWYDAPGALAFSGSGTGKGVDLPHAGMPNASSPMSISMWFYCTSAPALNNPYYLISLYASATPTSGVALGIYNGGSITVERYASPYFVVYTGNVTPCNSQWRHLVYTYDGGTSHKLYLGGTSQSLTTGTAGQDVAGVINDVTLGAWFGAGGYNMSGSIDDVRIYDVELTAAEVYNMASFRYPNRGGTATVTLGANTTVNGTLAVDSGTLASSGYTLNAAASDATKVATVDGTYAVGSTTNTFNGGLSVNGRGTLAMNTNNGTVRIANGKVLTIDGTFDASTAGLTRTIRNAGSGNYSFHVGKFATATPTLNINGLTVQHTDTDGMFINHTAGATTTFTRFDNISFSAGTGNYLLQIAHNTLTLFANGLSFDTTGTNATYNVKLTDRNGAGNDVRMFIGGTCVAPDDDCEAHDSDDDTMGVLGGSFDGVPDDDGNDGAVIQWGYRGYSDVGGAIESFPAVAFNWNTYAFRGTYVLTNNTSGGDKLIKRDTDGALYHASATWTLPNGEDFVGTPRWIHDTAQDKYYVYVISTAGRVYKLEDTGNSFSDVATFRDGNSATATSPLTLDTSNLYWAGASGTGTASMFKLPLATLTGVASVTTGVVYAAPSLFTISGTKYLFSAASTKVYKINTNFNPPSSIDLTNTTVRGRVTVVGGHVMFIDDAGKLWVIDGSSMAQVWTYQDTTSHACASGNSCESRNIYYDVLTGRVYYGDKDGHVYSVARNGTGGQLLWATPYDTGTEVIQAAPLYRAGVIAVGTTTGRVFFIDQRSTSATAPNAVAALIRAFHFGSVVINSISYDHDGGQYVIGTGDGKLYYIHASLVADPTNSWN